MPDVCMCVFICIPYIDNCTQITQKIWFFFMCVFYSIYFNLSVLFFRWSLESNWWNSLTKFYSIKPLMTSGVSNILCPFISMPSIDSSSLLIIHSSLSVSWTSVSLLLTSFHWYCFMFHHFPLLCFLCHNFLSYITDFISLSEIYYTYILNVVDESN